jgi:hypothetical protein
MKYMINIESFIKPGQFMILDASFSAGALHSAMGMMARQNI